MSDRSGSIRILRSKLTPPHIPDTIRRERLLSLMHRPAERRLTTVVAGAGYGKTTLVAQAACCWGIKVIWYRLDESDQDLATFISYLVAGMRKYWPEIGAGALRALKESHKPSNSLQPILAAFLGEMEDTLRDSPAVIVLDDYHSIQGSREIRGAMEILLRDLSHPAHLVLISRSEPALPLARLRAMREVVDVKEQDLSFTVEETERLYSEVLGFSLERANLDAIHQKMGGWISGLILLCHSLRGKPTWEVERDILNLRGPRKAIFGYLEENIYRALSPETQELLIRTSIFPRINASLCDRLFGIDYSLKVLRYVEENHLFTSSDDEEWYSYHQLFRDFLLTKLKEGLGREAIVELHRKAAALLERDGEEDEAVHHYLAAEEFERACGLLDLVGKRLFTEGRFQLLSSYLRSIPEDLLNGHPWIQYLGGQLAGLSGEHRQAIENYNKALQGFLGKMDEEGVQNCLAESGLIYFQTGNLEEARARFRELLERKNLDPRLQIEVLGYLIYISAYLGDMSFADHSFNGAMSLLKDLDDEDLRNKCLSWIYCYRGFGYAFSGEHAKVLEVAEYMKTMSNGSGPYRYPLAAYLLESTAYCGLQLFSKAHETAREGLRILGELSSRADTAGSGWHAPRLSLRGARGFPDALVPWLLATSAKGAAESGKITEAIEDAAESLKCFRRIGFRNGEAFAYSALHRAYIQSGNGTAAEQCARSGIEAIRGLSWKRIEGVLKLNLVELLIEKGEFNEAMQLITEAESCIRDAVLSAWINVVYARLHWSRGQVADGLHRLVSGLELCLRHSFDTRLTGAKHWIVPLLVEVFSQGKMRPYIQEIIGKMGPGAASHLALLKDSGNSAVREAASHLLKELGKISSPSLKILMLGRFRVFVDDREIPAQSWKSRKARTLFQFLVYSRNRGYLNKEVLMELLWPEEDPTLTVKRFHVALASLRKTLEPEIARGAPSSYISRSGDSYRIDLGTEGSADIDAFTEQLRHAKEESDPEKSIIHLLNAEALYGGDFLEDDPYSEWCFEAREKVKKDYLDVIGRVIRSYEQQGNYPKCIEYAERYLAVDEYAEAIYRSLMISHWKTGDKLRMARAFKRCKDKIMVELSCELCEETELLYRKLAKSR